MSQKERGAASKQERETIENDGIDGDRRATYNTHSHTSDLGQTCAVSLFVVCARNEDHFLAFLSDDWLSMNE
jgi:hypothetical protein